MFAELGIYLNNNSPIWFSTVAHYFSIHVIPNDRLEPDTGVYVICVMMVRFVPLSLSHTLTRSVSICRQMNRVHHQSGIIIIYISLLIHSDSAEARISSCSRINRSRTSHTKIIRSKPLPCNVFAICIYVFFFPISLQPIAMDQIIPAFIVSGFFFFCHFIYLHFEQRKKTTIEKCIRSAFRGVWVSNWKISICHVRIFMKICYLPFWCIPDGIVRCVSKVVILPNIIRCERDIIHS